MNNSVNILLLEDNFNDAELAHNQVLKSGIKFNWLHVTDWDGFVEAISSFKPDLILSDYDLRSFTGLDALEFVKKNCPSVPLIIVTGTLNEETAADTIKKGAWDYVVKERLTRLNTAIKNALDLSQEKEEKKKAEEKLTESEDKFRLLVENQGEGVAITDMDNNFLFTNPAAENIFGVTKGDLTDRNIAEFVTYEELENINRETDEREIGKKSTYEIEITSADNQIKTLLITATPSYSAKNEFNGTFGIFRDITARKQAEKELQQSYAFSNSLLKTIPFGMDIVDETGTVLFQSENFKELNRKNGVGEKCWDLYKDDKTQCQNCPIKKGINIGETAVYESNNVLNGKIFEIIHTGMMYQGKKAMLEIFQDITQRKEKEKELILAKERAEESDKLKSAFLQNISHEIRTPLNAIVGFSQYLNDNDVEAEERNNFTEIILRSSDQLLSIINDLLSISAIESGQEKIIENEININLTAKLIEEQFLPQTSNKNIPLSFNTFLPADEAMIITDATKLTQILTNLVGNALKFTKQGYVNFGYTVKNSQLEFYVEDSGIGIPLDMQDEIFIRFRQVETTSTRKYGGSGLGLSISKAYVDMFGGRMWLTSELGKGSIFYFTIPYQKANPKK